MSTTTALIRRLVDLGWTQTAISKRTGIPQPRLSRWAADGAPEAADDALNLQALVTEVNAAPQAEEAHHAA